MSTTAPASASSPSSQPLDFFRYHGIWAPGVRLFRRLGFRAKALLISAVLLIPAIVTGSAFLKSVQDQIEFTLEERSGVAAMTAFVPVLHHVVAVRNATRAKLGGLDTANDYSAARARVDASLAAFEAHLEKTGDPLQLREPTEVMKKAWDATASSAHGADSSGRTVFGPVADASLKVMVGITDRSKLVLDPDVDSLYTINAIFLEMPRVGDDLGQLWGWSTFAVSRGGMENPEQYRKFVVWSSRVSSGLEDARAFLDRAFANSPTLKDRIDLRGFDVAAKFQQQADPTELIKAAADAADVYAQGRQAVDAYFAVYDSALPALDSLLAARQDALTSSRNLNASIVALALLLAAYLFYCFARVMSGGLQEVAYYLDRMAGGDLTSAPSPWGRDEAAQLMHSLARMQTSVQRIVIDVRQASEAIVSASTEIAHGSLNLSERTEQTASELQATSASLEQVNSTLEHSTDNTRRAAGLATDNAEVARRSGEVIANAVSTMEEVNASSKKIADIIGVIDGIAFQTNILALNAAVEAARAGEQGRGFAVVASEVRSLAQRSAAAAREIKSLITDSVQKIQSGTTVVERAGDEMKVLVDGVGVISTLLGEISHAATEQSGGVRQVSSAVNQLDTLTQQNAALVEQTAAASDGLKRRADELLLTVSRFTVAEGA